MRWLLVLALFVRLPLFAGTAADLARAIRESSFDRDECYRVRDLTLFKEDIRIYLTDGHLIFSKPVAGKRIAAVFVADVEGGDAEVILLPPNRAERSALASYIGSPNLDEHFRAALFLFTGDDYERLKAQFPNNPANKKSPEMGPVLDDEWTPALHNLGASYQARLTLDLIGGPGHPAGLLAALISSTRFNNFDVVYDPESPEQIFAGQVTTRQNRLFFDTWTSFPSKSARQKPVPHQDALFLRDYRIEGEIQPDLSLSATTRVKVKPAADGLIVSAFDISPQMDVTSVTVDGRPAEALQRESLRLNLTRGGNNLFLVVPPEPLRAGREYEFEFHHSGKVIHEAGDRVFYVSARGNWYPTHGSQFATFDLIFRYPRDLDLVTAGDVVDDRVDGDWRVTRRRTASTIRVAGFNLGDYEHARVERAGYTIDVCANRTVEKALQMPPPALPAPPIGLRGRRTDPLSDAAVPAPPPPDPLARLQSLATEVGAALEFMAAKFGPPALPHLTVSPIPGTFGQGFPGLIYLSTISYLRGIPRPPGTRNEPQDLFFTDVLQAHETAHQWWGNRVAAGTYRDYWLMEALANYSALLYVEKTRGPHALDVMLDSYRSALLEKSEGGQTVESYGPIVLGPRLENSQEPRAWRNITYGKGSWIIQMLRRRMGDDRFISMLAELPKRYDRKELTTEEFRAVAAEFMPPKVDDAKLESFFDQWVYGSGIPTLKMTYTVKGKLPALKLVGTVTQSDVDEDFSTLVPIEIQTGRSQVVTHWVRSSSTPATFTVALKQLPTKVTLDPRKSVLRR